MPLPKLPPEAETSQLAQTDKTAELERTNRAQADVAAEQDAAIQELQSEEVVVPEPFVAFVERATGPDPGGNGYIELSTSYDDMVGVSVDVPANATVIVTGVAQLKARASRYAYAEISRSGPSDGNSVENFLLAGTGGDMDAPITQVWFQQLTEAGTYIWRVRAKSAGGNPRSLCFQQGCHIEVAVIGGDVEGE